MKEIIFFFKEIIFFWKNVEEFKIALNLCNEFSIILLEEMLLVSKEK